MLLQTRTLGRQQFQLSQSRVTTHSSSSATTMSGKIADQYWAEFNARSTVYSFTIKGDPSTQATSSPTATTIAPQLQATPEVQPWIILPFIIVTLLLVFVKRNVQNHGSQETLT